MKKQLKFALKLVVSIGLLYWIIIKTDWSQVLFFLGEIALWKLAVYVIVILMGVAISAYKWKMLAEFKNIKNNFFDFYRFYLAGTFINNFMPSFIGGDTFRAYQIGKPEKKYIEAASTVMADRITGLIGMTVLALVFSLINIKTTLENDLLVFMNLILILSLMIDILVAKTRNHRIWKKINDKIPEKIARFIFEVQEYSGNSNILSKTIFWGIIFQLIGVAIANLIIFWSLGINISLINYFSVIFLISIISSIPISINNIGLKEWAYVTFFGLYGIDATAAVTVAIISRFIQMIISFLALPTYLRSKE